MYLKAQHDLMTITHHTFEGCLIGMKAGGGVILCSTLHLVSQGIIEIGNRLIGNEPGMPIIIEDCNLDQFKNISDCTTIPLLDSSTDYTLYAIGVCVLTGSLYGMAQGISHIIYKKNQSN